jgi:hypothetical protein
MECNRHWAEKEQLTVTKESLFGSSCVIDGAMVTSPGTLGGFQHHDQNVSELLKSHLGTSNLHQSHMILGLR